VVYGTAVPTLPGVFARAHDPFSYAVVLAVVAVVSLVAVAVPASGSSRPFSQAKNSWWRSAAGQSA
jgi:hypothetical protein